MRSHQLEAPPRVTAVLTTCAGVFVELELVDRFSVLLRTATRLRFRFHADIFNALVICTLHIHTAEYDSIPIMRVLDNYVCTKPYKSRCDTPMYGALAIAILASVQPLDWVLTRQ
jgi:hypothetical protein